MTSFVFGGTRMHVVDGKPRAVAAAVDVGPRNGSRVRWNPGTRAKADESHMHAACWQRQRITLAASLDRIGAACAMNRQ